jgi:hypothetical protein
MIFCALLDIYFDTKILTLFHVLLCNVVISENFECRFLSSGTAISVK